MPKPFKFRYVSEIAGFFVLAALIGLAAALLLAGRAQGWFEKVSLYSIVLPADVPSGLKRGSEVQIFGSTVGAVHRIHIADDGAMEAEIRVRGDLVRFVREDSTAYIRRKFGVAGDAYVEITRGAGPELAGGARLPAQFDEDLARLLQDTVREVRDAFKLTLFQVNQLLHEHTELARRLHDPAEELRLVLRDAADLTAGLQAGEGTAGRLLKDPALYEQAGRGLEGMLAGIGEVRAILDDLKEVSARLPAVAAHLERESADLAGTVAQVQATLREIERLVVGFQRHWLVRRHIEPAGVAPAPWPASAAYVAGESGLLAPPAAPEGGGGP